MGDRKSPWATKARMEQFMEESKDAIPQEQQSTQPATAAQAQLPLRRTAEPPATAGAARPEQAISPKDLAKLMADNRAMTARLKEFEATQGKEASDRREAEALAAAERHNLELTSATAMAEKAMASARRNAVKAHFRGSLKADTYLALVPEVSFNESGDLTDESVAALDEFRKGHQELFVTPSSATTPMSAAGATDSASGLNPDMAAALRMNRIPLPGEDKHWSKRAAASTMGAFVGHNMTATPWKVEN